AEGDRRGVGTLAAVSLHPGGDVHRRHRSGVDAGEALAPGTRHCSNMHQLYRPTLGRGGYDRTVVTLSRDDARTRLVDADHGVLSTLHPERGVDAVPCVFAVDTDDFIGVPVDRVKPKRSQRLQRASNLEADP